MIEEEHISLMLRMLDIRSILYWAVFGGLAVGLFLAWRRTHRAAALVACLGFGFASVFNGWAAITGYFPQSRPSMSDLPELNEVVWLYAGFGLYGSALFVAAIATVLLVRHPLRGGA